MMHRVCQLPITMPIIISIIIMINAITNPSGSLATWASLCSFLFADCNDGANSVWGTGHRALLATDSKYAFAGGRLSADHVGECKNL